jgi:hypothetical protein
MIGGLVEINGEIYVAPATKGIVPIGIIDSNRTMAFSGNSTDEHVFIPSAAKEVNGVLVSAVDVIGSLQETNIIEGTFACDFSVQLNPKKGLIIIPEGTPLNHEEQLPDNRVIYGFDVTCSYRYVVTGYPGENDVDGSGMISLHFCRGTFLTDQFDTLSSYYPGCGLYVNCDALLTSQETDSPMVALALQPANAISNELLFMWL